MAAAGSYFYRDDFQYDEKGAAKHFKQKEVAVVLQKAAAALSAVEDFRKDTLSAAYAELSGELQVSPGKLIPPTRLAVSGRTMGPDLFTMLEVLGKEKVILRLRNAARYIEEKS